MNISELIEKAEKIKREYGDLEVSVELDCHGYDDTIIIKSNYIDLACIVDGKFELIGNGSEQNYGG